MSENYDKYLDLKAKVQEYDNHWSTQEGLRRFLCNRGYKCDGGCILDNYSSLIGKAWNVQDDWVGEDRNSFMNKIKEIREMFKEAIEEMGEGATITERQCEKEREELFDELMDVVEEFGLIDNIRYDFDSWE